MKSTYKSSSNTTYKSSSNTILKGQQPSSTLSPKKNDQPFVYFSLEALNNVRVLEKYHTLPNRRKLQILD